MPRGKTSLKIIVNADGSANINQTWSKAEFGHHIESSENIVTHLIGIPDYQWLYEIVKPHLQSKYCLKCSLYTDKICKSSDDTEFPYCFTEIK